MLVLGLTCGRADASPLSPVIRQLSSQDGLVSRVIELRLKGWSGREGRFASAYFEALNIIAAHCPDLILLLGDRTETLACAIAACHKNVPIAHVHAGDMCGVALENQNRAAISSMAAVSFAASLSARERLSGAAVHSGAPGIEDVTPGDGPRSGLIVLYNGYAPAKTMRREMEEVLLGCYMLDTVPSTLGITVIGPNDDVGAEGIEEAIRDDAHLNRGIYKRVGSLPRTCFLELLRTKAVFVTNSSAGIIEAPYARIPVVNVGDRQKGRDRTPEGILDCPPVAEIIHERIAEALHITVNPRGIYDSPIPGNRPSEIIASTIEKLLNQGERGTGI